MPAAKKKQAPPSPEPQTAPLDRSRTWWYAVVAILLVGALIRFWDLELKPLHHDEGVNGYFLRNLSEQGTFRYDPANYHGPTLPYFALAAIKLFGMNTWAIRSVPLLFGLGVIVLALTLRPKIGFTGTLAAGALLAISAGEVFHSRYFIHEMLLVFFTFSLVLSAWAFVERKSVWWLLPAAISASMMFATKETCIISFGVLAIASVMMVLDRRFVRRGASPQRDPFPRAGLIIAWVVSVAVAVALAVIFYSSFFHHWQGVRDSLHTFEIWAKTGEQAHVHPWFTYLKWLWKMESPILLLALAGTVAAVVQGGNRFALFCALWGWGTLAAYSLIPYKTPWLSLNALLPLTLVAGYAIEEAARVAGRTVAISITGVALAVLLYQSWSVNFMRYDDESVPYIYAPTDRQFLLMVRQINVLADRAGTGALTPVAVLYPEYWPLPWYLREYRTTNFYGNVVPTTDPIVIGSEGLRPQIEVLLGPGYRYVRSFHQRNGLASTIHVRREIIECPVNEFDTQTLSEIPLSPAPVAEVTVTP